MSLLPENASFEELVQDCFLAHRGAGLMLSPLDVELVVAWADSGVPFEVVARGIRRAAERALWDARPGEPALRSLRACRREVDQEMKKWRARSAGSHEHGAALSSEESAPSTPRLSFEEERHKKLRAALSKLSRQVPSFAPAAERLLAGPLREPTSDLKEADRREDLVIALLLRAQPFADRQRLYRDSAELAAGSELQSTHARKLSRRFHRHALVRRALELPPFW